jgi:hypothetical protein
LVAVKKNVFEIKKKNLVRFLNEKNEPGNQFFYHFTLIHKKTSKEVELFTTHLKAKPEFEP